MLLAPLPVHAGHALLHDALDLLEHVGVFLVNPVREVASVIQDLQGRQTLSHRPEDTEGLLTPKKAHGINREPESFLVTVEAGG